MNDSLLIAKNAIGKITERATNLVYSKKLDDRNALHTVFAMRVFFNTLRSYLYIQKDDIAFINDLSIEPVNYNVDIEQPCIDDEALAKDLVKVNEDFHPIIEIGVETRKASFMKTKRSVKSRVTSHRQKEPSEGSPMHMNKIMDKTLNRPIKNITYPINYVIL